MTLTLVTVGKKALLVTVHPPESRDENRILESLRAHIRIRKAEGAEDEDILQEVWKWWTGNRGPAHGPGEPPEEVVVFDPLRGPGGTWAAKALEFR